VLVGIGADDASADSEWLVRKLVDLRIFDDAAGAMNHALRDVDGDILAVSQFTLYASTRKGNRPSWSRAAPPAIARPMFDAFVAALEQRLGKAVPHGVFGAHMKVALVNDGPVTILLDSRERE
jgi:D-tyrosyl-tRNA(Tyr) deacylase